MNLSELHNKAVQADYIYDGQMGKFTFAPHRYSTKTQMELGKLSKDSDSPALARMLAGLVIDWDLEENGEKLPVTADAMIEHDVPFALLIVLANAIVERTSSSKNGSSS